HERRIGHGIDREVFARERRLYHASDGGIIIEYENPHFAGAEEIIVHLHSMSGIRGEIDVRRFRRRRAQRAFLGLETYHLLISSKFASKTKLLVSDSWLAEKLRSAQCRHACLEDLVRGRSRPQYCTAWNFRIVFPVLSNPGPQKRV